MGAAAGAATGPFITSAVYPTFGYAYTNVFFGGLMIIFGSLPLLFVKVSSDESPDASSQEGLNQMQDDYSIGFGKFLGNLLTV
jgi:hypothetical protein